MNTPTPESFYAIRLADGEMIYGEFSWMGCDGPDDWTVAEESDDSQPTEYEIVRMVVEPLARKTFGRPKCDGCYEPTEVLDDDGLCASCAVKEAGRV